MEKQEGLTKRWKEIWTSYSPKSLVAACLRRPLPFMLCGLILWIVCWYDPPDASAWPKEEQKAELTAQVEELTSYGDNLHLLVKDVTTPDGVRVCDRLVLYASSEKTSSEKCPDFFSLKIGNIIQFYGTVRPFQKPGNPGQCNEIEYYHSLGIDARMFVTSVTVIRDGVDAVAMALYKVRRFFCDAFYRLLPEREAGIVTAMVLGEKSGLTEEVKELYRENGIAHLLAISGLHISMIGMGLFFLLRKCLIPMHVSAIVTGMVLFLYGQLTGFPLSTRRSVLMMLVLLTAKVIGERYDRMNAWALTAIIELLIHPSFLFQTGFLLSYGTVGGILLFVGRLQALKLTEENSLRQVVYTFVSGSLGVFFVTLPILIQSYHEVPVYSVIVNAILLPFMGLLLGASLIGGGLTLVWGLAARFVFGIVYYILQCYRIVCEWVCLLPRHAWIIGHRSTVSVILYYLVIGVPAVTLREKPDVFQVQSGKKGSAGRRRSLHHKAYPVLIVLFLNVIVLLLPVTDKVGEWFPSFGYSGLMILNIDVGQGDCTCIRSEHGKTILIDGGSSDVKEVGRYRIVPCLKYYGIDTIDYMVITHSDADHVSGLKEILEKDGHFGLSVKCVIMPEVKNPDDAYKEFEDIVRKAGAGTDETSQKNSTGSIDLSKVSAGDQLTLDGAVFTCLHPTPDYVWEDVNDYSTVLQLSFGDFKALFTGDLGFHGEESMKAEALRKGTALPDVDYLKVGHHGSKNSSSDTFLSLIRPEIAVASAGKNNRYHHPSKEAVERLKASGALFFCTIESGAVTTRTDGINIDVVTYKSK